MLLPACRCVQRRHCLTVPEALGARHRELSLALKIKWNTLEVLIGEVEGCGDHGQLLVQEMRRAKEELDRITDDCEQLREETIQSLFQTAKLENEAVYDRVKEKVDAVKDEVVTLKERVDSVKDSERHLVQRLFKVVPITFLQGKHPEAAVWKPATHAQVAPYLQYLLEDLAPYPTIQLADGRVLSGTGEVLQYAKSDTVYFPQAVVVTPYL